MALQGNIDSFSVVDVLRLLDSSAKSGRLVVEGNLGTASLWLADGKLVAGTTARTGRAPVAADPAEVLFDIMRYSQGAFEFEAGIESDDPEAPLDVEPVIAEAESALVEWDEIVTVVPSSATRLGLAPEIGTDDVTLDQRLWSGVCAVAWSGRDRHGGSTVDSVADFLGFGELPAMRLARDLSVLGVVDVGDQVVDPNVGRDFASFDAFGQAFGGSFESFDGAADADRETLPEPQAVPVPEPQAVPEPEALAEPEPDPVAEPVAEHQPQPQPLPERHPQHLAATTDEPVDFEPPAYDAQPVTPVWGDDVAAEPAAATRSDAPDWGEPAPVAPAAVEAPTEHAATPAPQPVATSSDLDSIFGSVDPFADARRDAVAEAAAASASPSAGPDVDDLLPSVDASEEAAKQADLARQLAMLSPRAAEAVANADPTLSTEEEERARVAKFLGSV